MPPRDDDPDSDKSKASGDRPKVLVRVPHWRHRVTNVSMKSWKAQGKRLNSVVESWVDMDADVQAINRGEGRRDGERFHINGRTYFVKQDGGSFPVAGPGVHLLSSGAYFALKVYNTYGVSDEAAKRLDWEEISDGERAIARDLHLRLR